MKNFYRKFSKRYKIEYRIKIESGYLYLRTYINALCKLHALIKFKIKVKHNKRYQRKITTIERVKRYFK